MPSPSPSDRGGFTPSITLSPSPTGERPPRRLQRSRKRGYRTLPGVIYVGRPTVYGNPFDAKRFGHARSVLLYRRWLACELGALQLEALGFCPSEIDGLTRWRQRLENRLHQIAGRDLQCWCPITSRWCHADVLLSVANGGRA